MTNDGFHAYKYDAEGNIVSVDSGSTASYSYDALNHRGRSIVGSTVDEFVYNAAGQRATIWNGNTKTVIQGQYYWGGKRVAYYNGGSLHFQHQDWMGTEHIRSSYNGGGDGQFTSLPFGDDLTTTGGTDTDAYHFAQIDHDYETDTEHAQFRQYSSAQGRFLSPDPYGGSYDPSNPQSFNRYAYALNNPLSNVDPLGLTDESECPDGQTCTAGGSDGDGDGGDGSGNDIYYGATTTPLTQVPCSSDPSGYCYTTTVPEPTPDCSSSPLCAMEYQLLFGQLPQQVVPTLPLKGKAPNNATPAPTAWSYWKSCVATGFSTLADQMNPFTPSVSNSVQCAIDQASQASLAGAASWSVSQGLTVPLRSSIVRAGVGTSEALGEASGWITIANLYYGIAKAYKAEWQQCGW